MRVCHLFLGRPSIACVWQCSPKVISPILGTEPVAEPSLKKRQPERYSWDLKLSERVSSGASAILRILAQVCL